MIQRLVEEGANPAEFVRGPPLAVNDLLSGETRSGVCTRKTALSVAVYYENKEIITELVTSAGADVNQSLGAAGTVLHAASDDLVPHLLQLGADPHATGGRTDTALGHSLRIFVDVTTNRGLSLTLGHEREPQSALRKINILLFVTGNLDAILEEGLRALRGETLDTECVTLFLQHGARISYRQLCRAMFYRPRLQRCERFIELLLAADTDFSVARFDKYGLNSPPNLTVLFQKLSKPMTLQAWCVISVRRQLRSVSDRGMWARIEKLPLPSIITDQLKLIVW